MLANDEGRKLYLKFCINFTFENSARECKGSISSCLKRGSVWVLYLLLLINLMAAFCFK